MKLTNIFVLTCFFMFGMSLNGQPRLRLSGFKTYVPTFKSYQEQMNGKIESEYIGIGIDKIKNKTHISNWTLRVRAIGNYINQSNPALSVAPQFTSLKFSSINKNGMAPANTGPIPLSTSETVLISGALPLDPQTSGYYLQYKFDFIIQGGNHLLVANGDYRVSLEFLLYDGNNNLLDSFVLNNVGFQIQTGNDSNTLILQNSANNITFVFDELADFKNGLSRSKPLGLKVEYYSPYDIIVKTKSNVLTSATTSSKIPVSAIHLEVSQTQKNLPNLTLVAPFPLATSETVAVRNPSSNYQYYKVEYNLRYFIPSSETQNVLGLSGTYTTQLFFIAIPK